MKTKILLMIMSIITVLITMWLLNKVNISTMKALKTDMLITFTDQNLKVNYINFSNGSNDIVYSKNATDYPTAILSKDKRTLYFTDFDDKNQTQLFKVDLNSKEKQQLTNQIDTVDFLNIDEKKQRIYMRVLLNGDRNFHIASYDLINKKIEVWKSNDKDTSVKYFEFNQSNGNIYVLTYSEKEFYKNLVEFNEKQDTLKPVKYNFSIYNENGDKIKDLGSIKKHIQDFSTSTNGDKILFTEISNPESESNFSVYQMDTKNGEYTSIISSSSNNLLNLQQAQFSLDDRYLFFIAVPLNYELLTDVNGTKAKQKNIYQYDIFEKKLSKFWERKDGIINNFAILRTG